ncbi:MAG TPA: hypothetical protein PLV55_05670 [Anaerohalosphaeraceae bacterium]|nr:hypothetical protein [Anaerohalosphaeraceae bacterium]
MYRWYYLSIQDWQVLELQGLADCSGPNSTAADEILTREQYNNLIAGPLRSYLLANGIEKQIKVIITTAGLPYRIEDTKPNFADVVYPGGSNWSIVMNAECQVNAASVESELTCLWYLESGGNPCPIENRIVNPYQGCRSRFDLFERQMPYAEDLIWSFAISRKPGVDSPYMEGTAYGYGTVHRRFGPGRMYLVCRLDGPKNQGQSAIFAVRAMLERAKRAGSPQCGVNPKQAVVILDDAPKAPSGDIDYNRVFNLHDSSVNFWEYQGAPWPPDAYGNCVKNDYVEAFNSLSVGYFAQGALYFGSSPDMKDLPVILDYRERTCTSAAVFETLYAYFPDRTEPQGVIGFSCFGMNGDEGRTKTYLLNGGADGGVLFSFLNGAVFTSLESFNAVTLFSNVSTTQAKIVDFIKAGGTGAIGHSFEPQADAAVDNQFLYSNLLADRDGDGRADLTFAEAAWSAVPYLSWSEVVIGDPLMRIAYGPGQPKAWSCLFADANLDRVVNSVDLYIVRYFYGGILNTNEKEWFEKYYDFADVDQNGIVNSVDVYIIRYLYGTIYE